MERGEQNVLLLCLYMHKKTGEQFRSPVLH